MSRKKADEQKRMRSAEWFGRDGKYGFIPRSWMRSQGFGPELFDGRPVIGMTTDLPALALVLAAFFFFFFSCFSITSCSIKDAAWRPSSLLGSSDPSPNQFIILEK